MTAVPDVEFKIQPCADALIAQSRPSNQLCEGMQAVFVRDILEVNKTGLQFYGLPHPLAAAKNTTINWIKQNSSHRAEKAFVFLQVTDKCVGFKKYDKLPPNYKLALPASAYLKLLQFFGEKSDLFSEWKRVEKKMASQLNSMKLQNTEIRMGKSLVFVGNGECKFKKAIENFDDHDLSIFVCAKSTSANDPVIFLTYARREDAEGNATTITNFELPPLPEDSIQLHPETLHYLAQEGVPFFSNQLLNSTGSTNNPKRGYFTQAVPISTPPLQPTFQINVPFHQDQLDNIVQMTIGSSETPTTAKATATQSDLYKDIFGSSDDEDDKRKNKKLPPQPAAKTDNSVFLKTPLPSPLSPLPDDTAAPLPYYKMPDIFNSILGTTHTPAAALKKQMGKSMKNNSDGQNHSSKKPYDRSKSTNNSTSHAKVNTKKV